MRTRKSNISPFDSSRVIYGYCAGDGTIGYSSGDVTCLHTGTGTYTLNFNPPFPAGSLPIVVVMPYGGAQYVSVIVGAGPTFVSLVFANTPGGAGINTAFYFHVMGPQAK